MSKPPSKHKARQYGLSALWFVIATAVVACGKEPQAVERPPTSVKTQAVAISSWSSPIMLTGEIQARVQNDVAFRYSGRIASRSVDIGDHVVGGQELAALETDQQKADLDVAKAGVDAAQAALTQFKANFDRQAALLKQGYTTQSKYDDAKQSVISGQSTLDSAKASLGTATDQLENAVLRADAPGVITARNAEVGQIVEAAQAVFTIAKDGSRDAVFEVYEGLLARKPTDNPVEVRLLSNPNISASGKVREVAPAVDASTGTVRVKLEIANTPPEMGLGAPVSGLGYFQPHDVIELPWTAYFTDINGPAVWIVDPSTKAVSLRAVVVDSYTNDNILLRDGLKSGETVVTAGVQLLRPGEIVTPIDSPSSGKDAKL